MFEKHFIVPGLDRDLDVRHHLGELRHGLHQFFAEVVGVRGQEADALDAFDLMHDAQQAGKIWPIGDVLAVTVDDLAEQSNFLDALRRQRADLGHDVADRAGALHAAPVGDDAEGAGVRAAIDHRHMGADQPAAFVERQDELVIHRQEAAGRLGVLQGADLALGRGAR